MTDRREFVKVAGATALTVALDPLSLDHLSAYPPARLPAQARALRMDAAVRDLLMEALNAARLAGASYADVRVGRQRTNFIQTREQQIVAVGDSDTIGCGVRALVDGCWGFVATPRMTKEG